MAQRSPFLNGPGGRRDADAVNAASSASTAEPAHRAPTPFVWQRGRRLLLLDDEQRGWVMAELRFDVELCRYVEVRRATYRWAGEAVGAVLSRALASGDDAVEESARCLSHWLGKYYGMPLATDSDPPR